MILRIGSKGDDVPALQTALRSRGYSVHTIDGVFGPETDAAVKAFQKDCDQEPDGIVGPVTWSLLLSPSSDVHAVPDALPAAVSQWAPWLMKAQAEQQDPFPIERALRFLQLESGGKACATGRIDHTSGHVYEAGIAQTYFERPDTVVHGVTSAELRALCACEGTTTHGGECTDHAKEIHAQVAMADLKSHRARARVKLAGAGVPWAETDDDFWQAVKLVHALPAMFSFLRHAKDELGDGINFFTFKHWVLSRTELVEKMIKGKPTMVRVANPELFAIDHGASDYADAFERVFANCASFVQL